MTYNQLRLKSIKLLQNANIESAEHVVDQLILFSFNVTKVELLSKLHIELDLLFKPKFDTCLRRVLNLEPLDLVLGSSFFYKHEYFISKGVLVPRPETELLVDSLQDVLRNDFSENFNGLECGFGSGIISIELALAFPKSNWVSYDISPIAYDCAKQNSNNLGCNNVSWKLQDFFLDHSFEFNNDYPICLVSNPPYIPTADLSLLDKSVQLYDPKLALDGGDDGLDFYRRLFEVSCKHKSIKLVCFECGIHQANTIKIIGETNGFRIIKCIQDYQRIDRVLIFEKM